MLHTVPPGPPEAGTAGANLDVRLAECQYRPRYRRCAASGDASQKSSILVASPWAILREIAATSVDVVGAPANCGWVGGGRVGRLVSFGRIEPKIDGLIDLHRIAG